MRLPISEHKSLCHRATYTEKIEQKPDGKMLLVYLCDECENECRIVADVATYVSNCCSTEVLHPADENGKVIMPKTCRACRTAENLCICPLGEYFVCSRCQKKTNLVEVKKPKQKAKPRKKKP